MARSRTAILLACALAPAGCASTPPRLEFAGADERTAPAFAWSGPSDPYLAALRSEYELDRVVAPSDTDYQKVRKVCAWSHRQWKHNGSNEPEKKDPIAILRESRSAKRDFRCVEYSIIMAAALNAVGVKARVLSIRTKDMETRRSGAGHVVVEAYLADARRWVMADGQFDAVPLLDGRPISAVELQEALALHSPGLEVASDSGADAAGWLDWISPYLYFFAARIDQRFGDPMPSSPQLMLVPLGAPEPRVFQRLYPLKDEIYTRSKDVFYREPAGTTPMPARTPRRS